MEIIEKQCFSLNWLMFQESEGLGRLGPLSKKKDKQLRSCFIVWIQFCFLPLSVSRSVEMKWIHNTAILLESKKKLNFFYGQSLASQVLISSAPAPQPQKKTQEEARNGQLRMGKKGGGIVSMMEGGDKKTLKEYVQVNSVVQIIFFL